MDDCESKYLKDQLRTLQIKCDLLSQQSEHQQQMILHMKSSSCGSSSKKMKDENEDEEEGRNKVRKYSFSLSFYLSLSAYRFVFDIMQVLSRVHNFLSMFHVLLILHYDMLHYLFLIYQIRRKEVLCYVILSCVVLHLSSGGLINVLCVTLYHIIIINLHNVMRSSISFIVTFVFVTIIFNFILSHIISPFLFHDVMYVRTDIRTCCRLKRDTGWVPAHYLFLLRCEDYSLNASKRF